MSYHLNNLKCYFTLQIFTQTSKEDSILNRENTFNNLNLLTSLTSKCDYSEDYVLICHNIAFHTGFNYERISYDVKEVYKSSDNKIKWINNYFKELILSFSYLQSQSENEFLNLLTKYNATYLIFPFLFKGYKFFGGDIYGKMKKLYAILKPLAYKCEFILDRIIIANYFDSVLLNFNGNLKELKTDIEKQLQKIYKTIELGFKKVSIHTLKEDTNKFIGKELLITGKITKVKVNLTKNNTKWAAVTIKKESDFLDFNLYSDKYQELKQFLKTGNNIQIYLKVNLGWTNNEGETTKPRLDILDMHIVSN